jgi:hypothetical protein
MKQYKKKQDMKLRTWYEVFIDDNKFGTHTIRICKTLKEAKKAKKLFRIRQDILHIDKWQNIDNPIQIASIE